MRIFNSFNCAIVAASRDGKVQPQHIDRLVMVGGNLDGGLADDLRDAAGGFDDDLVSTEAAWNTVMLLVANHVGQMLVKGSTAKHI